ncbi:MAG: glyoxalase/bleomycin resistance/extradiol dioxygenase family protein [Bacteroidia bacterium]
MLAPYLIFEGTCEEAFEFYKNCFEGEIITLTRYNGSPEPVPEDYKEKVMHAELVFENNSIQGCDQMPGKLFVKGTDFSLSISVMEVFVLDKIFSRLAEGGTVTMPLQDTFWGARFGTITDRFGIRWMFSCDLN